MSPDPGLPSDPVIQRVTGAAPVQDDAMIGVTVRAAVVELSRSIAAQPVTKHNWMMRAPRRRLLSRRVVIVAAAMLSLSATAAVGYSISAHTGLFGAPGQTENDTSEFLNTGGSDFPAILRAMVPTEIALPPGESWRPATDALIAAGRREPTLQQAAGIRGGLAQYAYCSWVGRWLLVQGRGNTAASALAVSGIASVARSPVIAKVDGGGVVASMLRVATQADGGQVKPVRAEYELNCGQR